MNWKFVKDRLPLLAAASLSLPFLILLAQADSNPIEFQNPTGKLSQIFNGYLQPISGLPSYQERVDAELELAAGNGTYAAKLVPWTWVRIPDAVGGLPRKTRAFFDVREGWLERASDAWDIRLGNQLFSWGAADQINPTDVWNPRDYYDPFQIYKLPLFAARVKIHPPEHETLGLELIATPFLRESRLPIVIPEGTAVDVPLDSSRWLLPLPSRVVVGGLDAPLNYKMAPASFPTTWQVGARLSVLRVGGWDFSGSYFNGVENVPRIAFTRQGSAASAALPITVTMHPSYHRQQMWAADAAGSFNLFGNDFSTRLEAAYFVRDNTRAEGAAPELRADLIKDDYFQGVAGIDYTYPRKVLGTVLYWNLQYIYYQRVNGYENRPGQTVIQGLPKVVPWDSDLVLYFEDRITDTIKFAQNAIYSLEFGDYLLTPSFHVSLTDNFKTSLSADFFLGNPNGFFGQFKDNRRVNFSASYAF